VVRRRGRAETAMVVETADPRGATDPAESAVSRAALAAALDALGPQGSPQRETWRLMYVEDRSVAEVAELTGVPAGTVKSRAHHARRLLRAALGRDVALPEGGER
jgi:RNA polymerase sigma-70 factor, ECF subfamily